MNLDTLVAPLRADVESGAAELARAAAEVVERAVVEADGDEAGLRSLVTDLALRILDAQPAMAPLVHLASNVVSAAEEAGGEAEARKAVTAAARRFRRGVDAAEGEVAARALPLLERGGRIATISASSTVLAALRRVADSGADLEVVCLESRPRKEGRLAAGRLADAGVPVVFAVDAGAWWWAQRSAAVVVGADSVGDAGVVNKIGTRALAAAAREAGVPVYVLAARSKLLPPGFPQTLSDDRPGSEVWDAPGDIQVWNRYFEAVPPELVEGVVVEDAVLSAAGLEAARRRQTVPEPVRQWALRQEPPPRSRV